MVIHSCPFYHPYGLWKVEQESDHTGTIVSCARVTLAAQTGVNRQQHDIPPARRLDCGYDCPWTVTLTDTPAVARNILESSCSEIHAELAFLWIGTIVAFFLDFYLVVLGARQQSRGNREVSFSISVPYQIYQASQVHCNCNCTVVVPYSVRAVLRFRKAKAATILHTHPLPSHTIMSHESVRRTPAYDRSGHSLWRNTTSQPIQPSTTRSRTQWALSRGRSLEWLPAVVTCDVW